MLDVFSFPPKRHLVVPRADLCDRRALTAGRSDGQGAKGRQVGIAASKKAGARDSAEQALDGTAKADAPRRRPVRFAIKPEKPVSFMRQIAPIMVENCIACHNPRKSESKYVMTTFAQLAKGGQQGEGITLEPGKPDESRLVELMRLDGNPRMPFKQDPASPRKSSTSSSAGSPKGRNTTATLLAKTGQSCFARPNTLPFRRRIP